LQLRLCRSGARQVFDLPTQLRTFPEVFDLNFNGQRPKTLIQIAASQRLAAHLNGTAAGRSEAEHLINPFRSAMRPQVILPLQCIT